MCLNASFGQWCHCWCNPHQTLVNTHPPSSLCASTGQLSLLLLSADGLREWWGRAGRGGWLDSWADAKAPPGFAEDRPFPSHPAAVQLPRHQLSPAIAPNGQDTSSLCRLVENPVEVVLYSLTVHVQMTFCEHPPAHHYPQTNHAWKHTLPLSTFDHCLLHNEHNDYTARTQWRQYIYIYMGQITVQIHINGLCILQTELFVRLKSPGRAACTGQPIMTLVLWNPATCSSCWQQPEL